MKILDLENPFGGAVYHEETVTSTFDLARKLASQNSVPGTVISADFQEAGRGKMGRPWITERGKNLLFTILLRYRDYSCIPAALTLRTGLAVALAIEDFAPALSGKVQVKWPNDIMIEDRKAAGILTEADGEKVYIGVGVNVAQREFQLPAGSPENRFRPLSIIQVYPDMPENGRFILLEKILKRLHREIKGEEENSWRDRLLSRLYKRGETVVFCEGSANNATETPSLVKGILTGLGPGGELLIITNGITNGKGNELSFVSGELCQG